MADTFELFFTTGASYAMHRRKIGKIERSFPWSSLDPRRLPAPVVTRARHTWTLLSFNEYRSALAMATLNQALGQARVPLDLFSVASAFVSQELLHAELCARVAMRFGGGSALTYDAAALVEARPPELSIRQWADTLAVRYCCVGETLSLRLLAASRRSATNPLIKRVLGCLVKDEGLHSRFGWLYLDWAATDLPASERKRLGEVAREAIDAFAPVWRSAGSAKETHGAQLRALGFPEPDLYRRVGERAVESDVAAGLGRHGIGVARSR